MKVSFLLTAFYRKSKIKQKSRLALKLGNLIFALSEVGPLLSYFFLHAN